MEVSQILGDVRFKLSELEVQRADLVARREAITERIMAISAQIKEVEIEEQVLRRLATRYDIEVSGDGAVPREVLEWQGLPRTTAVERVLAESARPLSPTEITRILAENGRDDTAHHVSAALAHLKVADRAHQVVRGQWTVSDDGGSVRKDPDGARVNQELVDPAVHPEWSVNTG